MKLLLGICGLAIILFIFVRSEVWRKQRKVRAAFLDREPLTDQQFYEKYFKANHMPQHIPAKVRQIFAEQFQVDMGRLSSEDDLRGNLKFLFGFDSLVGVAIVMAIEDEFEIKITPQEAVETHTVAQITQLVCRKLEAQNEA